MSQRDPKFAKKIALLTLADSLGNVAEACRLLGISRDSFYRYQERFRDFGTEGLKSHPYQSTSRKRPVTEQLNDKIVLLATTSPRLGKKKLCEELRKENVFVSPSSVRLILVRNNLETYSKRRTRSLSAVANVEPPLSQQTEKEKED